MSLINQMLKDLDARHEDDARSRLHREVRALPGVPQRSPLRVMLGVLLLVALAATATWIYLQQAADPASSPAVVASAPGGGASDAQPRAVAAEALSPPTATPEAVTPGAVTASTVPAVQLPMPVVDDTSGLKLSAVLDRLPIATPADNRALGAAAPRREALPAKHVAASAVTPGPRLAPAPTSTPTPIPVDGVPASAAKAVPPVSAAPTGSVEKRPPLQQSGRDKAEADYRRALTLVNGARVPEATDLLLDALRHDGGHVAARQLLSRLLIEQRRLDEAMAILAEGVVAQPGQVGWAMSLARLQVERNDLPGAARTLQIAQPYATGNADYQGFSGHIQYRLGNAAAAVSFYRAATAAGPSDGRWWLGLGLSLEAMQVPNEAREAFLRARATGNLSGDLGALVDQKLR